MKRWWHIHLVLGVLAGASSPAAAAGPYWAMFADGTKVTGERIDGWDVRNRPRLGGRELFDPLNPVRLLRDTRRHPILAGPHVEFLNGDVLAGRVVGYGTPKAPGAETSALAVQLQSPLRGPPRLVDTAYVRTEYVRRIVLSDRPAGPYRPGVVVRHDGRTLRAQAVRFTTHGARVLTGDGIQEISFSALRQLDMPPPPPGKPDVIQALLADALTPCPKSDSLTGRITVTNGSVLTCRIAALGPAGVWGRWRSLVRIQPAWALHAMQITLKDVCVLSCRTHNELPASFLPAETLEQRSFTGFRWPWRRNRNVLGGRLSSGAITADLGVGTHSYSAIALRLPDGAQDVGFLAGLDQSVQAGGCVVLKVYRDRIAGQPLWQSGYLRGQEPCVRAGPIPCRGASRIVLVTEFGHEGRPAGADPADVRDHVNWILPTVRLDADRLERDARQRLWRSFDLGDWSIRDPKGPRTIVRAVWDARDWRWQPLLEVPPGGLRLTKRARVEADPAGLCVAATRDAGHLALRVSAGGKELKTTAPRDGAKGEPVLRRTWDLASFREKEVVLTLRIDPPDRKTRLLGGLTIRSWGMKGLPLRIAAVAPPRAAAPPRAGKRPPRPAVPLPPSARAGRHIPAPPDPMPRPGGTLVVEGSVANYSVRLPAADIHRASNGRMAMRILNVPPGRHFVQLAAGIKRLACQATVPTEGEVLVSADFAKETITAEALTGRRRALDVFVGTRALRVPFVRVPAGTFRMGSPPSERDHGQDEGPVHEVVIRRPFFLAATEVTREQFQAFQADRAARAAMAPKRPPTDRRAPRRPTRSYPGFTQGPNHPAAGINWHEATAFCDWLGYKTGRPVRLPTEAEWEYACRAGAVGAYCWGDSPPAGKGWCNAADEAAKKQFRTWVTFPWSDGHTYTSPAGAFRPNAFGLYDMHGNVREWCADWYDGKYYAASAREDPRGASGGTMRVLRGGSWGAGPRSCRSASRSRRRPDEKDLKTGFRVLIETN